MDGLREVYVIAGAELRRAVRSARVVVLLLLYGMFSTLVLLVVGSISNAIKSRVSQQLTTQGVDGDQLTQAYGQARRGILGLFFSDDAAMVEALQKIPLVVLLVFKIALFFLPAYIALLGFDQISGEVGTRSIRYLTVRSRRSSVLLGKFIAQGCVLLALVLAVDAGVFAYARITNPDWSTATMAASLLRFWLASIVFSLAYLAVTSLCSTLFRQPAVSLVFNVIVLFGFWLIDAIGSRISGFTSAAIDTGEPATTSPFAAIRYLSPSHYATDLLHPSFAHFGVSGGAYAAFAAVFLVASYALLRWRDV